MIGGMQHQTIR